MSVNLTKIRNVTVANSIYINEAGNPFYNLKMLLTKKKYFDIISMLLVMMTVLYGAMAKW